MKFAVIVFPGSNCDHDAYSATKKSLGYEAEYVWHKDTVMPSDIDCVIVPGGFSYGDYLRCGAIASMSPIIREVKNFANKGGLVIGICNGFQILTESGLLPGALLQNTNLNFLCKDIHIKIENNTSAFTNLAEKDSVIKVPIAHFEGNFFAEKDVIEELEAENRVIFRYSDANGIVSPDFNPNGSINNIAGIINKAGNVLGMMPHPERYSDPILGCDDGKIVFNSIAAFINKKA